MLFRFQTGTAWRDLLERFGDGVGVHRRFSRWDKAKAWKRVLDHLAANVENEYAMIGSTVVRAHQHSVGARENWPGPSHRPLARQVEHKIHTLVDVLGNPIRFALTGG